MSSGFDVLSQRVFEVLVNASCAALVLMLFIWAALTLARGASAAFRSMIWTGGLGAALLLPALLVFLPATWRLQPLGLGRLEVSRIVSHPAAVAAPAPRSPMVQAPHGASLPEMATSHPWPELPERLGPIAIRLALAVWLAGALFILARFAIGNLLLSVRSRATRPGSHRDWQTAARAAAGELAVGADVRLLQDEKTATPAVWGLRQATIFLPLLAEWSFERKRIILLHEFAHIKRGDPQRLWLNQLVAAVYWFHPAVRLALNESRMACEQACDDLVLDTGVPPCDYASHLLEVSACLPTRIPLYTCVSLLGTQSLERRVASILNSAASRRVPNRPAKMVAAAALLPLVALLAAARPLASEPPPADTAATAPIERSRLAPVVAPVLLTAPTPLTPAANEPATHADSSQAAPHEFLPAPLTQEPPATQPSVPANETVSPPASDIAPTPPATSEPSPAPVNESALTSPPVGAVVSAAVAPAPTPSEPPRVTLRAGTQLQLIYAESINTKNALVGSAVTFTLVTDLKVDGAVVARAGSTAIGTIVNVKKAKPPGRSGALALRLDGLQVGGRQVKLTAPEPKNGGEVRYSRPFALKWPLGLFRTGDDVDIPQGTGLVACVADNIELPVIDN